MEDLSKLLLDERAHSEQFKTNFIQLKIEFDKLVNENQRLQEEISKHKEYKPQEPNEALKRKLKNIEKELQGKDYLIVSLQEKLQIINDILKEKLRHEELYTTKITSTETALEQTKMLLSNLQLETSALVKNVEKSRKTEEQDHQRDLMTLADRCAKYDYEKRLIAHQVIKATAKAQSTTESLKQENGLLSSTITKLKECMDKVCWEKSELSSQIETLKVQQGQERGEMLMQIRNLECESAKLQAKSESLERNMQEALREKEKASLSFRIAENDSVKLRSDLCALEMKLEKVTDQFKRDTEQKDFKHNLEIEELKKAIHALKVELDQERLKIQHQADKLLKHEKELITAKEELRKKELEVNSQTQDVKIATENKYRVLLEEKFQTEMETSRKCAEIESQLILERNLKASLEFDIRKLTSTNQTLNERLRSLEEFEADKKRLQNTVELLEKEKNILAEEFNRHKQTSAERYDILVREREMAQSQLTVAEEKMSKTVTDLQQHIEQLQSRLEASGREAESQVKKLQSALKTNQQKSQQYAKLIWKLRQRLASQQQSVTPATPAT